MMASAREQSATLSEPEPDDCCVKFGESSIDFQLIVWSEEMSRRPSRFKSDLNYLICKHLDAAEIELPNPQGDLHTRSGVLKVQNVSDGERAKDPSGRTTQ